MDSNSPNPYESPSSPSRMQTSIRWSERIAWRTCAAIAAFWSVGSFLLAAYALGNQFSLGLVILSLIGFASHVSNLLLSAIYWNASRGRPFVLSYTILLLVTVLPVACFSVYLGSLSGREWSFIAAGLTVGMFPYLLGGLIFLLKALRRI